MSYFEDYIEDGLCCQICGEVIDGKEPGVPRKCDFCSGKAFEKVDKIERNRQRSNYAIKQFKKNQITFALKNESTGHFHTYRKYDKQLFQFWAGTGKIVGPIPKSVNNDRGIETLIRILNEKGEKTNENTSKSNNNKSFRR